jgi:uncharacterized surface protein with fasciclin (FAS1) repeats
MIDLRFTNLKELQKHKGEYIDINGLCLIFNICKRTVYVWMNKNIIKSKKVGNTVYFLVDDILNLFE